ncbi:hypothetical protein ACPA5B_06620 [Pseudomonas solani]|uniref:hypothetical protein n=1 Tax=Pseudomonas solani TaxID=2731552 RepID=UPI003C2BA9B2
MRIGFGYAPENALHEMPSMRTPSRRMPGSEPERPPVLLRYRLLAIAVSGSLLLAIWLKPILLIGLVALAFLGVAEHVTRSRHIQRLAQERRGESICQFARTFPRREVDTWVIRAVYKGLHDYLGGALPIRAGDHLRKDLRVDGEDLDLDLLGPIAARCGRSLESTDLNPWFGKVHRVQDLVRFLDHQPRLTSA